ncbi:MAG: hypothetical protein E7456_03750 [Ruminococcaceae bacterium]|nr:hypothetical protein [Oscillospiraceae bacterium]
MKTTMLIITILNILALIGYLILHKIRIKKDSVNVVYRMEEAGPILIGTSWFMCALMLWTYTKSVATIYVMLPCSILGLFMVLPYFTIRLKYDDAGFEYRNMFGIKLKADYSDVKGIRTNTVPRIYFKNYSITVVQVDPKIKAFLDKLERGYVAATGRGVKKSTTFKAKKDPLNYGNGIGWVMFVCYLFVAVLGAFGCFRVMHQAFILPWEKQEIKTHFYFYNYYGNDQIAYDDAGLSAGDYEELFVIKEYERYGEQLGPLSYICQGETYNLTVDKEGDIYFIISMTDEDGRVYVSPDISDEIYDSYVRSQDVTLCIGCALVVVYGIVGILVNRNPERYSKWVRALYRVRKREQ